MMAIDYDAMAVRYAQNRQIHPEVFRALFSTSSVEAAGRVLEVGCGTGNYIVALKSATGCICAGLDPSAGMLSKAKARSVSINFQLGRAEAIPFQSNVFDLVFSVDVIHHVNKRLAYFREAYRLLKTGGKICTVTDSESIIRHRQPLATYFPETIEPELKRYPRIAQLRQMMERAGFRELVEKTVEFHYELRDIQPYQARAYSALHLISDAAFRRGLGRMRADLLAGSIPCVSRYLLLSGTK